MSFPRLNWLVLPVALGLPLLTGGCGVPLAVTAASYGADGVSVAATKKTTTDHSFWRVFKHQTMCKPRETDKDPYQVNYDEPFRMQAEGGGVSYGAPLHASSDAPPVAWEASAYKAPANDQKPAPGTPTTAIAKAPLEAPLGTPAGTPAAAPPEPAPVSAVAAAPPPAKAKKKVASNKTKPKKPSPSQVASVR